MAAAVRLTPEAIRLAESQPLPAGTQRTKTVARHALSLAPKEAHEGLSAAQIQAIDAKYLLKTEVYNALAWLSGVLCVALIVGFVVGAIFCPPVAVLGVALFMSTLVGSVIGGISIGFFMGKTDEVHNAWSQALLDAPIMPKNEEVTKLLHAQEQEREAALDEALADVLAGQGPQAPSVIEFNPLDSGS